MDVVGERELLNDQQEQDPKTYVIHETTRNKREGIQFDAFRGSLYSYPDQLSLRPRRDLESRDAVSFGFRGNNHVREY